MSHEPSTLPVRTPTVTPFGIPRSAWSGLLAFVYVAVFAAGLATGFGLAVYGSTLVATTAELIGVWAIGVGVVAVTPSLARRVLDALAR